MLLIMAPSHTEPDSQESPLEEIPSFGREGISDSIADQTPNRRSTRRIKPIRVSPTVTEPTQTKPTPTARDTRRNPKRKATEASKILQGLPDDLLVEALRPLEPKEIEEWEGWVELESEPVSTVITGYDNIVDSHRRSSI